MAKKKVAKRPAAKASKKPVKRPAAKSTGAAEAIRKLDAEFMKAANGKNAGALVKAFYAADAVLMPPNHPIVEGTTAIQGFLQGLIDGGLTSIKLETTSVAASGDLACGQGRYALSLSPAGAAPIQDEGKYIVVYRRQSNGSWRAVSDIFNSDHGEH
jgi:ketosteroid isomerase-like protein